MYTTPKGQIDNPLTFFFADLDTLTPRREVSPAEVKSRSFRSDCNVYTQEGRRGNVSKRLMSHIPAVTDQPSKRELQPDGCSQLGLYDPLSQDWVQARLCISILCAWACACWDPNCMNILSAGVQNERRYLSNLTYFGSAYLP